MAIVDRVRELVLPIVEAEAVDLYDIEYNGGVLRIFVDDVDRVLGDESTGIDIGVIKRISRAVSHLLDEIDPIPGRYTLEISSPGLERPLRTPEHWRRVVGVTVTLKTLPHVDGERRIQGVLSAADGDGVEISNGNGVRRVCYSDISKARTVFQWGPTPKPGGSKKINDKNPEKKAPTS